MSATLTDRPRLRLQVAMVNGKPRVLFPEAESKRKPFYVHDRGTVKLPIYRERWSSKKQRRSYVRYRVTWFDARGRHRESRSSFAEAKARADEIATDILNGQTAMIGFSQAERASYLRSCELVAPFGKTIELAASEYSEAMKLAGGRVAPAEAVRFWLAQNEIGVTPKPAALVVEEMLARRIIRRRVISSKWKRMLKTMLDRFAAHFTGPLHLLRAREVDDWLDTLRNKKGGALVGLRTRKNYRAAIGELVAFAQNRGYVSKSFDLIESVSCPEPPRVDVATYTPQELSILLAKAESYEAGRKLVPLITITAFAGIRHGEMNEEKVHLLDWANIKLARRRITIPSAASKIGEPRSVDIPENLAAWLAPYARTTGKICELSNTWDALCRLRKKAGIAGKKRNALRKSFITYRLALTSNIEATADEAGNSPQIIRSNYKHVDEDTRELAQRWFSIMPVRADVLPLWESVRR